jgi:hypothetical protein
MEENTEPESFIVQNVTLGPHYVSDIRLNFGPLEAIDLTWEDSKVIKASKDLRTSLRMGFLRKISSEQFDNIEEKAAIRGKKELLRQQNANNLRTVDVDGKQLEVETIDTEKVYKKETEVSTAGYANDSLSYATAFDIAQTQAQLRGDELSIEEFAEQVNNNANLVQNLLRQQKNLDENSSTSGDSRRGKAFVAEASDNPVNGTSVKQVNLTNYNRDRVVAGSEMNFLDAPDDDGIADTIDLETEIDLESEKGSIRRV